MRWGSDRPCAVSFNALDQLLVFLGRPTALDDIVCHLGKPPLSTILVCSVWDMFCDSMPFGGVRIVWVLWEKVSCGQWGGRGVADLSGRRRGGAGPLWRSRTCVLEQR